MQYSSPEKPPRRIWRLSKGAEQHSREIGLFEVRYHNNQSVRFSSLLAAFVFYIKLEEPASLWDVTEEAVLIEEKVWLTPLHTRPPEDNLNGDWPDARLQ